MLCAYFPYKRLKQKHYEHCAAWMTGLFVYLGISGPQIMLL